MLELLIDKKLRKNYYSILNLQKPEEINEFLSSLDEKDKHNLFCYTYGYAIRDRQKKGISITEYFLLHYNEFIPEVEKGVFDRADQHLNIIFNICIITIIIVYIITTNWNTVLN